MKPPTITNDERIGSCGVCVTGEVEEYTGYRTSARVTSDCRPWPNGGRLGICKACGLVQKPATGQFLAEIQDIYDSYEIYHQGDGAEQAVFQSMAGMPAARSKMLIDAFVHAIPLPARGRMLDVGCGNGATLRAFGARVPHWSLVGAELNDKHRSEIENIPGVESMHAGPIGKIRGTFDVITLIHTLEHIIDPMPWLAALASHLTPTGVLLVQVPCYLDNPFDLMVADHRSHFSPTTLKRVIENAGYEVTGATKNWISRELSITASPRRDSASCAVCSHVDTKSARTTLHNILRWLDQATAAARQAASAGPVGVFGTSIAAAWYFANNSEGISFFVDEDPNRIGRAYLGRPVLAPNDVPPGATVYIGLTPTVAEGVSQRIARPGIRCVLPPRRWESPTRGG